MVMNLNFRQETGEIVEFTTSSYLQNDEKELEFLKKISEILIIMLLPRGYALSPLKDLLCEIIAFKGIPELGFSFIYIRVYFLRLFI